jgi:hypothetical protein
MRKLVSYRGKNKYCEGIWKQTDVVIFDPVRDEVKRHWMNLHKGDPDSSYCSVSEDG